MVTGLSPKADFSGLVDEQLDIGDPPLGEPSNGWKINSQHNREFPFSAVIDLGQVTPLATLWIYDTNNKGELRVETGAPDKWTPAGAYDCGAYKQWASVPLETETRYLRLTLMSPAAIFTEIALDAYSPNGWLAVQRKKAAEALREAERAAAMRKAREEALKRPMVEMPPYGRLSLVDEIACGEGGAGHEFTEFPENGSRVESILGQSCRVMPAVEKSCSYFSYRIGKRKLLRPGGVYVLAVDYPEDAPRTLIVINTGNETSRGFHTGPTVGDALHPKYVHNHCESIDVPLSGRMETWSLLLRLHDRFSERGLVRGSDAPRTLTPEDGFDVTLAQFSKENAPLSQGIAASRIRLFEVIDPDQLPAAVNLPGGDLPVRRLFWREEMSDGVIGGKNPEDRGIDEPIEWFRHKAELARFLGMNTYSKDLLEFGACQHWDPAPHGGNDWVYHNAEMKGLWGGIVELMGDYGLDVLPCYEYGGSIGTHGLGNQKRCRPLTRDDAYTHISWVEKCNADITDPDTLGDFRKMLDCTVAHWSDKAKFAGIWLRSRGQMPVGFGPGTLERFAREANDGEKIDRPNLIADQALYDRYIAWWQLKRRDFLTGVRDSLREKGIENPQVLFTGVTGETGVGFASWDPHFVTDNPERWRSTFARPEHARDDDRELRILTPAEVVTEGLYLDGLTAPSLNWGSWEVHHGRPADDPAHYQDAEGVLLTHAFHRGFTVSDPRTFDLFRTRSGLAAIRFYSLNENMMFDAGDKPRLGYFVCDIERAGPYSMMAEALAVASGDPTMFGYLAGNNFGRGFPVYARNFNANFLALPALPSKLVPEASSDPEVVVRSIETPGKRHFAVVNTSKNPKREIAIKTGGNVVTALAGGEPVPNEGGTVKLDFYPFQLISLGVEPVE